MNRRTFFEGLGRIALLAIPFSSRFGWAKALDGKADMPEDGLVLIYDSLNFNGYRTLLEKARLFTDSNEMPTLWDVQRIPQKYGPSSVGMEKTLNTSVGRRFSQYAAENPTLNFGTMNGSAPGNARTHKFIIPSLAIGGP